MDATQPTPFTQEESSGQTVNPKFQNVSAARYINTGEQYRRKINEIPDQIQWHENMLIGPHHFQQNVRRQEGLLHYHIGNMIPFYWGVRHINIDKNQLLTNVFSVSSLEGIMPDGMEINYSSQTDGELSIDLESYKKTIKNDELTVYLVSPVFNPDISMGKGDTSRYRSIQGDQVKDENSGENPIEIPRLKPAISLLIADQIFARYVGFPIAKIVYKDANFVLTDFIPPALTVSNLPKIKAIGEDITKRLREKANFLSEKAISTGSSSGMSVVLEIKDKIKSLVSILPYFETVLKADSNHPYQLYLAMSLLVGHLAALDAGQIPPVLPPYDHNDLNMIFNTAEAYISRVLEQGVQERYSSFPFKYRPEEGRFVIHLKEEWLTDEIIIGVHGQSGMNRHDVDDWISKCIIGSLSEFKSMQERRIPGVERKPIEGNEFLVPMGGLLLFSLKLDSKFIHANEELVIFNPGNLVPGNLNADNIVLYVENSLNGN